MATNTRSPPKMVQLVSHGGDFSEKDMETLIFYSNAQEDHPYAVVSVIGPQSGGKSTLMNAMFATKFDVMNAKIKRGRTTQGIWAGICNNPRVVVLDVEGSDSAEVKNGTGFENWSALFALAISDVIFVNVWLTNVGNAHGIPLLTHIFQERVKMIGPKGLPERHETAIIFSVRDYDYQTPEEVLKKSIISMVYEIWKSIPQSEGSKLQKYFKVHVELFPNIMNNEDDFYSKCVATKDRIANGHYGNRRNSNLRVSDFPSDAKELWEKIVQNKTLDLPSQRELRARYQCSAIIHGKLQRFRSIAYPTLIIPGNDDPREFHDKLQKILANTLSEFEKETSVYGICIEDEMKQLKTNILNHAKPEFVKIMEKLQNAILQKSTEQIRCEKGVFDWENKASSVVSQCRREFEIKTEGLKLYYYLVDEKTFVEKLDSSVRKLAAKIKRKELVNLAAKAGTGTLVTVATAATGGIAAVVPVAVGAIGAATASLLVAGGAIASGVAAGVSSRRTRTNVKENTGAESSKSDPQR